MASALLRMSTSSFRFLSASAFISASLIILSISSSDKPLLDLMVIRAEAQGQSGPQEDGVYDAEYKEV